MVHSTPLPFLIDSPSSSTLLLTASQYANKAWTTACGWECDEVLGLTCAFLQGECTDLKVTAAFTKDLKEVGYATMKVTNYRKDGTLFSATVHVFPVYDTVSPTGADGDDPVLTHFATVLEDMETVSLEQAQRMVPESVAHCLAPAADRLPSLNSSVKLVGVDRRLQSRKCEVEYVLTADRFELIGATVRLSDLLRLMLGSLEAMVLTDSQGRILHVNKPWRKLCGYSLSDVEGRSCAILQGPMTDLLAVRRCEQVYRKEGRPASMTVANYRKDGLMFNNCVTIVPIRGGYLHGEVTHYCALLQAVAVDRTVPTSAARSGEPFLDLTVDPEMVVGELDAVLSGVFKRNRERDPDTWSEDVERDVFDTERVGVAGRDVNYFECEEDEEEEEDLTLRHMPFAMATQSQPQSQAVKEACAPSSGKMVVEGEADNQTVDTRYGGGGSMVSGATDGAHTFVSAHSSSSIKSSGSTVVLYKESDSRARRSSDSHPSSDTDTKDFPQDTTGPLKSLECGPRKHLTITLPSKMDSHSYSSSDSSSDASGSTGPASSGSDDTLSTVGMRKQSFSPSGSSTTLDSCPAEPSRQLARKRSTGSVCGGGGGSKSLVEQVALTRLSDVNSPASS
jgi:PAS domain S-box-containing protein